MSTTVHRNDIAEEHESKMTSPMEITKLNQLGQQDTNCFVFIMKKYNNVHFMDALSCLKILAIKNYNILINMHLCHYVFVSNENDHSYTHLNYTISTFNSNNIEKVNTILHYNNCITDVNKNYWHLGRTEN